MAGGREATADEVAGVAPTRRPSGRASAAAPERRSRASGAAEGKAAEGKVAEGKAATSSSAVTERRAQPKATPPSVNDASQPSCGTSLSTIPDAARNASGAPTPAAHAAAAHAAAAHAAAAAPLNAASGVCVHVSLELKRHAGELPANLASQAQKLAQLTRSLREAPDMGAHYYARACTLLTLKMFSEAAHDADACLRLQPGHAKARFAKGRALYFLKEYESAFAQYDARLLSAPPMPIIPAHPPSSPLPQVRRRASARAQLAHRGVAQGRAQEAGVYRRRAAGAGRPHATA